MKKLPLVFFTLDMVNDDTKAFYIGLYHKFYSLMAYRAYLYTNDRSMVEDIIQDALLSLLQRYDRLRMLDEKRLAGYIALTVRSVAINALRKQNRNNNFVALMDSDYLAGPLCDNPEIQHIRNEERAALGQALRSLPANQRELLIEKYILEKSTAELAASSQTNEPAVRKRLSRARRALVKILEELGDGQGQK